MATISKVGWLGWVIATVLIASSMAGIGLFFFFGIRAERRQLREHPELRRELRRSYGSFELERLQKKQTRKKQ